MRRGQKDEEELNALLALGDEELNARLRAEWGFDANSSITVVGYIDAPTVQSGTHGFLRQIQHPSNGQPLAYPGSSDPSAYAFVSSRDVRFLAGKTDGDRAKVAVLADLQLAPLDERRKHSSAFYCNVRSGSLRLLSDVPVEWSLDIVGPASAPLILEAARTALLARASAEATAKRQILERETERLRDELGAVRSEQASAAQQLEILRSRHDQLSEANAGLQKEFERMTEHVRQFSDLLRERGGRLLALRLVDKEDLAKLIPIDGDGPERAGHSFQDALGGDFPQLASYVQARLWAQGMAYSKAQLRDFLALLQAHDMVVLAGDSGSGKTSLVRHVAASIGARCTVIPVKPNWTSPDDLLGYFNPIERAYRPTPFLEALLAADREPGVLHFICLDEMNLARVEHYFADFLSLLEERSKEPIIPLYSSDEEQHAVVEGDIFLAIDAEVRRRTGLPDDVSFDAMLSHQEAGKLLRKLGGLDDAESALTYHARLRRSLGAITRTPPQVRFPSNVRIFGAVNIDETTHYLSPKVLDRVHVVRFGNPALLDWEEIEAEMESFDLDLSLPVTLTPDDLGQRSEYPRFDPADETAKLLIELVREYLHPIGVEFGLRAIRQSLAYIEKAEATGIGPQAALNNIVLHKILPKITFDASRKGTDGREKAVALEALRTFLSEILTDLEPGDVTEHCAAELEAMLSAADDNNRIVNYWAR